MATAAYITWSVLVGIALGVYIGWKFGRWYTLGWLYIRSCSQSEQVIPCEICGAPGSGWMWSRDDGEPKAVWLCGPCAEEDFCHCCHQQGDDDESN